MDYKLPIEQGHRCMLAPSDGFRGKSYHVFSKEMIYAVEAAIIAERPLLIRGEPGVGKSQLARAVAQILERKLFSAVVNASTEPEDLLWRYDAVGRIGNAQAGEKGEILDYHKYLCPSLLWWAFNYESAKTQIKDSCFQPTTVPSDEIWVQNNEKLEKKSWLPQDGCVVLIDEIDKAGQELPNSLLETLGEGTFHIPYPAKDKENCVTMVGDKKPIVMITTNEDRQLPKAFVRRCLVLNLEFPEKSLLDIARAHFTDYSHITDEQRESIYKEAERGILEARQKNYGPTDPKPGLSEFLDLIKIVLHIHKDKPQLELSTIFNNVKKYNIEKGLQNV